MSYLLLLTSERFVALECRMEARPRVDTRTPDHDTVTKRWDTMLNVGRRLKQSSVRPSEL